MSWIKRNKYWIGGGLLAVALFGSAGWFLYVKIDEDGKISEELTAQTTLLQELSTKKPHPGTATVDNIGEATREQKDTAEILRQMKQLFPQPPVSTNVAKNEDEASRAFREALDAANDRIQRKALMSGTELPRDFYFTFEPQKGLLSFTTNSIGPLSEQLKQIVDLCDVVLSAKPASILSLKRVPVATEDVGTQSFLIDRPVTNQFGILSPYEITFLGLSETLASVLEGFLHGNNNFVVRNVRVPPQTSTPFASSTEPLPEQTMTATPVVRATRPVTGTVLTEKPIKIILEVDAVKFLKPTN